MFYAALDLSGTEALFAVTDEHYSVMINEKRPLAGRTSSQLVPWIIELLKDKKIPLDNIKKWTIGSGPGSFTGLRLVASFVEGLTFNKDVQTRCVPSAIAIADAINSEKETKLTNNGKIAVLFNGYNNELLLFCLELKNHNFIPAIDGAFVLNKESFNEINNGKIISPYDNNKTLLFENIHYICLEKDNEVIKAILPEKEQLNLTIIESLNPLALIKNNTIDFDGNLTKLEYIRPAVYQ